MTVAQAAALLLRMEAEFGGGICGPEARAVGLARVGHESQVERFFFFFFFFFFSCLCR